MSFDEAIFGGPARSENCNYWIAREGAEPVLVPVIERFHLLVTKLPLGRAGGLEAPLHLVNEGSTRLRGRR